MTDLLNFWNQHTPIFSILLPAFTAFVLVLLGNPGSGSLVTDWRQPWRRGISYVSSILGLIIAVRSMFIRWANGSHLLVLYWFSIISLR